MIDKEHPLEIEKKFLINSLPANLEDYPHSVIEQGYLCRQPVLRVRRIDSNYILTYKSLGMMVREEHEHPLTKQSYDHLLEKTDGTIISKTRYYIPDNMGNTIELDIFCGSLSGFIMAEVEFSSKEDAVSYKKPTWFGDEVTMNKDFHNSRLSEMDKEECNQFLSNHGLGVKTPKPWLQVLFRAYNIIIYI